MTDSLDRLYQAVSPPRRADPATSRTARLLRAGRAKMAKKLAEEAVEVVIDAMHGEPDAVVRESADLLYNLVVLWVAAGVHPKDVWAEMNRRERLLGIAEKLPKNAPDAARAAQGRRARRAAAASGADGGRSARAGFRLAALPRRSGHSPRPPLSRPAMLRRLYDWCIAAAGKPYATWIMGIVSFTESSFFPIPPDAMLIPMSLARPDKAWFYATVCTLTSVAGGVLGYFIGAVLYDSVGQWLIQLYGYGDKVEAFRAAYAEWGGWIILLKGLTPIPYKIVTIASGFAGYNLFMFVLLSFVARGMRFYLLAFLLNRYGAQARAIIEERLGFWVTIGTIVLVVGIIAALYLF